jgi:AhpD family alkylhydroperoxidase
MKGEPMPRIAPVDYAVASDRQKELLDSVRTSLGATPNMTTTMARSSVLEGWLGINAALREGPIGVADGERIALAVAEANGCSYCLSAHTYLGAKVARLDDAEIQRARHFGSSDAKSDAILAFAGALVAAKGGVSDSDIEAARAAQLTDAELGDIVGHLAVNVLTNYFNKAFAVDVDFPVVEPHEHATVA